MKSICLKFLIVSTTIATLYLSGSGLGLVYNVSVEVLLLFNLIWVFYSLKLRNFKIQMTISDVNQIFLLFIIIGIVSLVSNFSIVGLSIWSRYFLTISLAWLIVINFTSKDIFEYIVKVIAFIALVSLAGYLIFTIFRIPADVMPKVAKATDNSVKYYTVGFFNIWISEFDRNCGAFWEPSIFAAYLSIAIILLSFNQISLKNKKCIFFLLSLTLITTKSTGGYLLYIMASGIWLFRNKRYNMIVTLFVALISIVLVVVWPQVQFYLLKMNYRVFSKLFYFDSMGTTLTRVYSVIINYDIWKEKPITGVGLVEAGRLYLLKRTQIQLKGLAPAQTSTSALFIASFGLGGLYYTYIWMKACFVQKISRVQKMLLAIVILFIINQTPHTFFLLSYLLMFTMIKSEKDWILEKV